MSSRNQLRAYNVGLYGEQIRGWKILWKPALHFREERYMWWLSEHALWCKHEPWRIWNCQNCVNHNMSVLRPKLLCYLIEDINMSLILHIIYITCMPKERTGSGFGKQLATVKGEDFSAVARYGYEHVNNSCTFSSLTPLKKLFMRCVEYIFTNGERN